MAAGQPFLASDVDRWLMGVLSIDPFLQEYAPGGFWARDPDQISNGSWSSTKAYNVNDIVTGSDSQPYRSLIADNVGNDPTESPTDWAFCFPCVRWWQVAPGRDLARQDGQSGRIATNPKYFICMLDRQRGGSIDLIGGSEGTLELGVLRIYTLIHGRNETVTFPGDRIFQMTANRQFPDTRIESANGDYNVMNGHQFQIYAQ